MENKEIKQAKKILEKISQDEHERYLAELRQKHIMDQHAIEDRAFDKGLEAGIERGVQKEKTDIVKKMKAEKFDIDIISKITGLSIEEIDNID